MPVIVNFEEKSKVWSQILATATCSLCVFGQGLHFAWPSFAIPKLLSDEFPGEITKEEISLILLIGPLSFLVASPLYGYLSGVIGRKKTLLLLVLPQLTSWIIIANARTFAHFCIARLMSSASDAGMKVVYPMYVGEISEPKIRGRLASTLSSCSLFGQFVVVTYGSYTSIAFSAYISCLVPILFFLTFSWMPESPYYLLMKNKRQEAEKSLKRLRRMENVEVELREVEKAVKRQMSESGKMKDLLLIKSNRKALIFSLCMRTIQQFTGVAAVTFYSQVIFEEAGDILSPKVLSLIYLFLQILSVFVGSLVVDFFGRKPFFISSSAATTLNLIILGTYFLLRDMEYLMPDLLWLPILFMMLYRIALSLGISFVPNLMLSEVFPANVKSQCLTICAIHFAICSSLTSGVFHFFEDNLGMFAPFYFYAACTLLGTIYACIWMPETKGKSLEDIQQLLKGKVS